MGEGAVPKMAREGAAAQEELYRRIRLALFLRVIMVTFLLVATVVIHFTRTPSFLTTPLVALYLLTGITYFITLISLAVLRWTQRLKLIANLHIVWEVVFVTALIYVTTGKYESIFSFLYLLVIIMAGILLYRRGAFLAAVLGSLAYGALVGGFEDGILRDIAGEYQRSGWNNVIYAFFINLAAMFGMAFFSSYLTEKLRATGDELEETLRDRDALEALNDDIVHSISSGLLTLDRHGRITSFNEAAEIITGLPRRKALGIDFKDLFRHQEAWTNDENDVLNRALGRFELEWDKNEEETKHFEFRISPLKGPRDERMGTLVTFDDVTEMKRMEQRLRKSDRLAAVGQLAAGIAHEIRNPLASISGSIQILDSDLALDETGHKLMRIVIRETDRLNSLITDFLLYARPTPRNIEEFSLHRLVRDVIEVCRHRTDIPANLDWNTDLEEGLLVETDPKLIEQIIWNLINNAIEAMPEGGVLSIRAFACKAKADEKSKAGEEKDIDRIRMEISDTGKGIAPEVADKIFDPFFTTRERGTGLGLSTVYRIVDSMEGNVWVEQNPGGGAKFVMEFPRCIKIGAAAGPDSAERDVNKPRRV